MESNPQTVFLDYLIFMASILSKKLNDFANDVQKYKILVSSKRKKGKNFQTSKLWVRIILYF